MSRRGGSWPRRGARGSFPYGYFQNGYYPRNWMNPLPMYYDQSKWLEFNSQHPPTNAERYLSFETMLREGKDAPYKVYLAMYWLGFADHEDADLTSPLFENDPWGHAEDRLLEHLKLQLDVVRMERLKYLIIMQNASPCASCSEKYGTILGNLQEKKGDIEIVLVFSSLYKPWDHSCRQGLRNLGEKGVSLGTSGFYDWRRLRLALQIPFETFLQSKGSYKSSPLGKEDRRLKGVLAEILA